MSALLTLFQNLIDGWISNTLTSLVTFFTAGYATSTQAIGSIFYDANVQHVMFCVQGLALAILAIRVGYEILNTYLLYMAGDGTADPKGVLFRTAKAAAFIMGVPWVIGWLLTFSISLANDVGTIGSVSVGGNPISLLDPGNLAGAAVGVLLLTIVALVLWLLINLQMACRAVEIGVLAMVGPLMAIGFVSPSEGLGGGWWKELVVQMMAQPLQILMLRLTLIVMGTTAITGYGYFLIIGWLWVTYKSPKIVQQFAMSTGIGGASAGAAQIVGKALF